MDSLAGMDQPLDPFRRNPKAAVSPGQTPPQSTRLNRHDRLRRYCKISGEVSRLYSIDPSSGAKLFVESKKAFLEEEWTLNHFQSPESRELLVRLNTFFRGRDGAPPVESVSRGENLRPRAMPERWARQPTAAPSQRQSWTGETCWEKDPRLLMLMAVLALLLIFFGILLLEPVPPKDLPKELISSQPFPP